MILTWNLQTLDSCSAKSIIRLWHDLHTVRGSEHTFIDMTSPQSYDTYFAIVRHGEIRAVAACQRSSELQLQRIAYPYDCQKSPVYLMSHLQASNIRSCTESFKRVQPKFYLEWLILKSLEE